MFKNITLKISYLNMGIFSTTKVQLFIQFLNIPDNICMWGSSEILISLKIWCIRTYVYSPFGLSYDLIIKPIFFNMEPMDNTKGDPMFLFYF